MLTTPPVVADCVQQYKTPIPTPAVTPALDEVQRQEKENWDKWNNRWGTRTPELMAEGKKRAMLWADMPREWSDVLHAYYEIKSRAADYSPGLHDSDKIQNTIDTLERVKRSQNNTVERENIDKIINQLNMDLMYFRIKHGK